jgi:acyl carrier protein
MGQSCPEFILMTVPEATSVIYSVLSSGYGLDKASFGLKEAFRSAMDSLELAQLMLDLEDEFGIEIPEEDFQFVGCIECAAEYAVRKSA